MKIGDVTLRALNKPGALEKPRWWAHLAWVVAVGGSLLVAYAHWSRLDVGSLIAKRWAWGPAGAVLAGAFAVFPIVGAWQGDTRVPRLPARAPTLQGHEVLGTGDSRGARRIRDHALVRRPKPIAFPFPGDT
jgi:hypothetical protein